MAGSPTNAEIQQQWKNGVAVLEAGRLWADGTALGLLDTVEQALEGDYLPASHSACSNDYRAALASLVSASRAQQWLIPVLYEYGKFIRSPYSDASRLFRDIYDYFIANSLSVKSRAITFDSSATLGASNVGNGTISRLTVDQNNMPMEAVCVETKTWKCRSDQNSGAQKHAEIFEVYGQEAGPDGLLRASRGSGVNGRTYVRAHHAGSGAGGSILRNSTFSTFDSTATPKFSGWTEVSGGANLSQDTTNYYRGHPGGETNGSLKATGVFKITQGTDEWRTSQLDPDRPYFCRLMVNKDIGAAVGGSIVLRLGSKSVTLALASFAAGWNEIIVSTGQDAWFKRFNEDTLDIEIEWTAYTSGYLLMDDCLFAPWDFIDGGYWFNRGGTTPWMLDDSLEYTDTGGAPTTAKIQWWLYVAGLGYLPTNGAPTFTDP